MSGAWDAEDHGRAHSHGLACQSEAAKEDKKEAKA